MSQSFTELGTIQYQGRSSVGTLPYVANLPLKVLDIVRGGRVYETKRIQRKLRITAGS